MHFLYGKDWVEKGEAEAPIFILAVRTLFGIWTFGIEMETLSYTMELNKQMNE